MGAGTVLQCCPSRSGGDQGRLPTHVPAAAAFKTSFLHAAYSLLQNTQADVIPHEQTGGLAGTWHGQPRCWLAPRTISAYRFASCICTTSSGSSLHVVHFTDMSDFPRHLYLGKGVDRGQLHCRNPRRGSNQGIT